MNLTPKNPHQTNQTIWRIKNVY